MSNLQIFNNEKFGQVRTLVINGQPYVVGIDVARILGYARPSEAVTRHCRYTLKQSIPHPQSKTKTMEVNCIPEGDIYRLIINSKLPEAEKFESWIFDEVIPSIRRHGMYATDSVIDQILNNPDFGIRLLQELKEERNKRLELEKTNNILMHVNKTYTATEIAKEIGFKSAIALNNDLAKKRIQYKQNGTWVLYSDYANKGYVEIKQEVLDNGKVIYHRRWTQLGREFLLNLYAADKQA